MDVVHCPPISKTKGWLKWRRCKRGKELPQIRIVVGCVKGMDITLLCPSKDDVQNCYMSLERWCSKLWSCKEKKEKCFWKGKFKSGVSLKSL